MVCFLLFALLLLCSSEGGRFEALNQTTPVMTKVFRRESSTSPLAYLQLPVFVDSKEPLVEKKHFFPTRGTGLEPLPEPVRDILLPGPRDSSPPRDSGVSVKTVCKSNKMLVQVTKSVLGAGEPDSELKLGTCRSSKSTRADVYFEYELEMCGTKRTMINNRVAYSNTLHYDPLRIEGPIRRTAPFTLPVSCYYNRYQYSYKIGFSPKMRLHKVFKSMKDRAKFILTPRNANWERLYPSDQYVLGKPMYFEAEGPSLSKDERLYVHSCYATPEKSHRSTPQFPVVKNFGCMVESKDSRSRFIPYKNNAVRFSVDAFLFKGMTDKPLYMHCTMSVGRSLPTPTAKSCNYDTKAGRWMELHGSDAVCDCCDSNCTSAASAVNKVVSSRSWTIEPRVKTPTTTTTNRKKFTTTRTSTTTRTTRTSRTSRTSRTTSTSTTAPPPPKTTRELTERTTTMATSQPEEMASTLRSQVDNKVTELKWPFGGKGGRWVKLELKETQERGSAVVEELEKTEVVTDHHRTFEDLFDFDK